MRLVGRISEWERIPTSGATGLNQTDDFAEELPRFGKILTPMSLVDLLNDTFFLMARFDF